MNKHERERYMASRIYTLLEAIENKTGKMAHEIEGLSEKLKRWQDKEIKTSYFNLFVIDFLEKMED